MLPSPNSSPNREGVLGDLTNTPRRSKTTRAFHDADVEEPDSPTARHLKPEASFPTPGSAACAEKRSGLFANVARRPLKRPRFDVEEATDEDVPTAPTVPVLGSSSKARKRTVFTMRTTAAQGRLFSQWNQPLPTRAILASFVSSEKTGVYRIHSEYDNFLTLPYACSFSHAARRDGKPILAVSTEQGPVHLLDLSSRAPWDPEPPRTVLRPHENGTFDVRWSPSDMLLATCGADHTAAVSDPSREDAPPIHVLQGHGATLKCVAWANSSVAGTDAVLATGGRDGVVRVWDIRVAEACVATLSLRLPQDGAKTKGKGKKKVAPVPPRSVTSLLFPEEDAFALVGSSSSDGILRRWDLRQPSAPSSAKHTDPGILLPMHFSACDPTTHAGSPRPRGLNSVVTGTGPSAGLLFALGADARVHTYCASSLEPLPTAIGSLGHPALSATSFYVRAAMSPCGRWLATGCAGAAGSAFLFDVAGLGRAAARASVPARAALTDGVRVRAQAGEVGAVDFARDGLLATCADEGTVRAWRPDAAVAARCRADPNDARLDWAWAENSTGQV